MSKAITKPRVITIAGSTGTGKSQLAVVLAEKFNGEIINGDALQLYEGLPIATNKLPFCERNGIPHHLLGCVRLDEEPWQVGNYVHTASDVIKDISARGKVPIIVGGTHYYTQSLLFETSLPERTEPECQTTEAQEERWPILAASTQDIFRELRKIDPEISSRWHPNDRRKIRHSLEIYLTCGKKPSELYCEQREATAAVRLPQFPRLEIHDTDEEATCNSVNSLRFDPLILWIYADLDKLYPRLDDRVELMVQDGLLEEVASMLQNLQEQQQLRNHVDQSSGIWTAIGFKELVPYVSASLAGDVGEERLEKMKRTGIELTKTATRQYAKRQQRWIRGKLLQALEENNSLNRMVLLDGTDVSQWHQTVEATAIDVVSAFLKGNPIPKPAASTDSASKILVPKAKTNLKARYCEVCDITMMMEQEWDDHPRTKRHRKASKTPVDWQALYPKKNSQDNVTHSEPALGKA
ncbi:MAG: hypothetical protein Q9201_005585 [Fulgogasparrea decipioides]